MDKIKFIDYANFDIKNEISGKNFAYRSIELIKEKAMRRLAAIGWFLLLIWGFSGMAWATSASISVSGNEGWITITGHGEFSSYEHCNSNGCWTVDSGYIYLYYKDTQLLSYESGNGSATCSSELNAAYLPNGTYTFIQKQQTPRG